MERAEKLQKYLGDWVQRTDALIALIDEMKIHAPRALQDKANALIVDVRESALKREPEPAVEPEAPKKAVRNG